MGKDSPINPNKVTQSTAKVLPRQTAESVPVSVSSLVGSNPSNLARQKVEDNQNLLINALRSTLEKNTEGITPTAVSSLVGSNATEEQKKDAEARSKYRSSRFWSGSAESAGGAIEAVQDVAAKTKPIEATEQGITDRELKSRGYERPPEDRYTNFASNPIKQLTDWSAEKGYTDKFINALNPAKEALYNKSEEIAQRGEEYGQRLTPFQRGTAELLANVEQNVISDGIAMVTGRMLGAGTGIISDLMMGLPAYGSALRDAREKGLEGDAARKYALLSAGIEVGSEHMFDIGGVNGYSLGLEDIIDEQIDNAFTRPFNKYLMHEAASVLTEGGEEFFASIASDARDRAMLGQDKEFGQVLSDAGEAFMQGALSALILSGARGNLSESGYNNYRADLAIQYLKMPTSDRASVINRIAELYDVKPDLLEKEINKQTDAALKDVEPEVLFRAISNTPIAEVNGLSVYEYVGQRNKDQKTALKMLKRMGNAYLAEDLGNDKKGAPIAGVTLQDGTVLVSARATDPVSWVTAHEGVHRARGTEGWDKFITDANRYMREAMGDEFDSWFNDLTGAYAQYYTEVGAPDMSQDADTIKQWFSEKGREKYETDTNFKNKIDEEVAAYYVQKHLLHDNQAMKRFLNTTGNVAQQVFQSIKDTVSGFGNDLTEEQKAIADIEQRYSKLIADQKGYKADTKYALDAVSEFTSKFGETEDGRVLPTDPNALTNEDWKTIQKALDKLGYGLGSAQTAKEVYSRYVFDNGFNAEQSDAIRKAFGVAKSEQKQGNPVRARQAKAMFGTTGNFNEAGYLLQDGSMLDFSGKRDGGEPGRRAMDHRDINAVFDEEGNGTQSWFMDKFIDEGNVRLMPEQGATIGEIEPNAKQYSVLKKFVDHLLDTDGYFYLDLSNANGITVASREYTKADSGNKVINDIKAYFKNGELPYRSEFADYRYALSPDFAQQYMDAVNRKDMATAESIRREWAEQQGYDRESYHGTMNGGFTVFDKQYANPEGNSGAGFYSTTDFDDADDHYRDAEGADNYFKRSALAEQILDAGEWNGEPVEDYDTAYEIATDELNQNPQVYNLAFRTKNPYIRDFDDSTSIDLMGDSLEFAGSSLDREDYDNEDDYTEAVYDYAYENMGETINEAVWEALRSMEDNYEEVDFPSSDRIEDLVGDLAMYASDYGGITFDDVYRAVDDDMPDISVLRYNGTQFDNATGELTRAIIENLGYDSIIDREVDRKFNQLIQASSGAEHYIAFDPSQYKLSDTVTYDDNGNVIPIDQRYNRNNPDIRYSLNDMGEPLSEGQQEYFRNSVVRNADGNLKVMYHGSDIEFNEFDKNKIRSVDYDAPFNGFWFSSDPNTSPAMHDAKVRRAFYLNITNPAPSEVYDRVDREIDESYTRAIRAAFGEDGTQGLYDDNANDRLQRELINQGWHEGSRSMNDELRYRLQDMGYDGIHWDGIPDVNWNELYETGITTYKGMRGETRQLELYTHNPDSAWLAEYAPDGFDYNYENGDNITGYSDRNDFERLQEEVWVAFEPNQIKRTDNLNPSESNDIRYSLGEIVDDNGHSYGIGVHLDSTLLDGLSEAEQKEMVREYVKELGGQSFTAFDEQGDPIDITIAEYGRRFVNRHGDVRRVNEDLIRKNRKRAIKREAVVHIDELIQSANHEKNEPSKYTHDWLDNQGKNNWDKWNVYLQDKGNAIYEATLNVTTTVDGEKILYDIDPIKKVGQAGKTATSTTENNNTMQNSNVNGSMYSLNGKQYPSWEDVPNQEGNWGYHAGDLGKAEPRFSQGYSRGTGHFGTGTYFVGNPSELRYGYGDRPVESVDFSQYNLFAPQNGDDAYTLHEFLRSVDGKMFADRAYTDEEIDDYNFRATEGAMSEDPNVILSLIEEGREMLGDNFQDALDLLNRWEGTRLNDREIWDSTTDQVIAPVTNEELLPYGEDALYAIMEMMSDSSFRSRGWADQQNALNRSYGMVNDVARILGRTPEKVLNLATEIDTTDFGQDRNATDDSLATRFMKALGYEGVDVRNVPDFDNTRYGSVIYDLKGNDLERKQANGARFSFDIPEQANAYPMRNNPRDMVAMRTLGDIDRERESIDPERTESVNPSEWEAPPEYNRHTDFLTDAEAESMINEWDNPYNPVNQYIEGQEVNTKVKNSPEDIESWQDLISKSEVDPKMPTMEEVEMYQSINGNNAGARMGINTLEQILDHMAGKNTELREKLRDIFERPRFEAKKTYVENMKKVVNEYESMIEKTGIEGGTKESAAIQWYGEGVKKEDGKETPYTLEDLKKEFPDKWEDIVEFHDWMRSWYKDYVPRANKVLEQIYPDPDKTHRADVARWTAKVRDNNRVIRNSPNATERTLAEAENIELLRKIESTQEKIDNGTYRQNKRLNPRQNYFMHFQDLEKNGIGMLKDILSASKQAEKGNIDTELVTVSEYTKPRSRWLSQLQHRGDGEYTADAVTGFARYAKALEYAIAFDPLISQYRDETSKIVKATKNTRNANTLIDYLNEYTNQLAGKTVPLDRALTKFIGSEGGRAKIFGLLEAINQRGKANAVVGNLRSALAQPFNIPNAMSIIKSDKAWAKGARDYLKAKLGDRSLLEQSPFLAERYSDLNWKDYQARDTFFKKLTGKMSDMTSELMEFGDREASELIWLSAYNEALDKGVSDPVFYADDRTRRSVAGRGVGEVPYNMKSRLAGFFAPFQVESNNQWQNLKGMVEDKDAVGIFRLMLGSYLMNAMVKPLFNDGVLPDVLDVLINGIRDLFDREEGETVSGILKDTGKRLAGETLSMLPGVNTWLPLLMDSKVSKELFGENDPTRYGTGTVGISQIAKTVADALDDDGQFDLVTPLLQLGLPTGGKQASRLYNTLQDLNVIPSNGVLNTPFGGETNPVAGSYTDAGNLRYRLPEGVESFDDAAELARALAFGSNATNAAREYYDSGKMALSSKKVETLREHPDINPEDYINMLREADANGNKSITQQEAYDWLSKQDLTDKERNELWEMASSSWKKSYNDYADKSGNGETPSTTPTSKKELTKAADSDGNGNLNQAEAFAWLNSQDLTDEEKAALWELAGWKTDYETYKSKH